MAICLTVRDEAAEVPALVESLLEQTRTPDELVVVDGGSGDGTLELLREALHGVEFATVLAEPGSNIAQGRNAAIAHTTAGLIAVTDAGISRPATWLAALLEAAEAHPQAAGSFGYILAAPHTTFESALGAVALPLAGEIDAAAYPPSSGSVLFRREWLERAGKYPAWLDYGEDLWLDRRIWSLGGWFAHASGADVGIRPRSDLGAFFRQYYNYATGDGFGRMLGQRHLVRYGVYVATLALLRRPTAWRTALLALLALGYLRRSYARLPKLLKLASIPNAPVAAGLIPLLRLTGDVAKMAGYLTGRRRRRGGR